MQMQLKQMLHMDCEPVGMLGSHNGRITNTIAPYGSACQSILFGAQQLNAPLANKLSLTMPYVLWSGLAMDLDKSSLTTHSWRNIEKRL